MATAADFHPRRAVEADTALKGIHNAGLAAHLSRSSAIKPNIALVLYGYRWFQNPEKTIGFDKV